ncbi:hypothetical protein BGZ95_009240 [Linnemannia exigua]|uniref:Uncharacterized protein n=1 Tax=Linnemannia exigua TaxID=604196 RepID=A0AAD4H6T8_9FUNG|nr:hypothetical protein BGZ95_009240 [Linnemannia exigua]
MAAPTLNISSSETPMVAVGTHSFSFGNKTEGYSVVFNNGTGGTVYKATGDAATLDKNNMLVLEQKESYKLDMNNIQLTNYSVPVTMSASISDTAYILDKKLEEVIVSGDIPQYSGSGSLVATSVAKSIVVYSLTSDSVPRVHVFDTESKKWSMAVVQSGPRQMEKSTLGYVFSIVGCFGTASKDASVV